MIQYTRQADKPDVGVVELATHQHVDEEVGGGVDGEQQPLEGGEDVEEVAVAAVQAVEGVRSHAVGHQHRRAGHVAGDEDGDDGHQQLGHPSLLRSLASLYKVRGVAVVVIIMMMMMIASKGAIQDL